MPGKLCYFDMNGLSDAIRNMLRHANFQYEDERLSLEEFAAKKASGELSSLPAWIEDGFTTTQSNAILRSLAIRLGYYHEDPMITWNIDSLMDYI